MLYLQYKIFIIKSVRVHDYFYYEYFYYKAVSKWGYASNNRVLNYTLYPETGSTLDNVDVTFPVTLSGTNTTQRVKKASNAVKFKSLGGFYDTDTNLYASAKPGPARLNQ